MKESQNNKEDKYCRFKMESYARGGKNETQDR